MILHMPLDPKMPPKWPPKSSLWGPWGIPFCKNAHKSAFQKNTENLDVKKYRKYSKMVPQKWRKKQEKCDLGRLWRARGSQDSPRVPHNTNSSWFGVPPASSFHEKTRFYDGNVLSSFLLFLDRTKVFSSQLSSSAPALRIKPLQRGGLGEAHLDTVDGRKNQSIYSKGTKGKKGKGD